MTGNRQRGAEETPFLVLIVEDEADIRSTFESILEGEHCRTRGAATLSEAEDLLEVFPPDLVLLDLGLPDGSGLDLIPKIREQHPDAEVIVVTAETRVQSAVQAMQSGATDFLEKPVGLDRLLTTVGLARERKVLRQENLVLKQQALGRFEILGHSPSILEMKEMIQKVASSQLPVLITGENGTGKELVARNLHLLSPRSSAPFLAVNCAAIPENLLEAEFFGHEAGAFTGATQARKGLFREAGQGTLLLDEIGEMPKTLQSSLLRVLQERRARAVGGSAEYPVHCRILAATNRNLEEEVASDAFREDLYYRIRGVEIHVPALRERRQDIPLLAKELLKKSSPRGKLSKEAQDWLKEQSWPGNVRQLASLLEAAALLAAEETIRAEDLERLHRGSGNRGAEAAPSRNSNSAEDLWGHFLAMDDLRKFRESVEREFLRRKLEEENWNVSATARRVGIRRTNLHERLKSLGLR
ncbi:MAG TPA: sigma-54-dependent Fis family transcriptional regulator [Planctomycetes bacterium]|nr:sigma-54-dependent Fis family transcriptional regulator [Planctomycetota bacterium]